MVNDIRQWLEGLGLGEYADAFEENRIDANVLPELINDDLKDIGVLAVGDRRKLLSAIAVLSEGYREPRDEGVKPAGKQIATQPGQKSLGAERRQLTIVFCDLVGSTALSRQLDPEELRDVMRRYQDAVAGAVTRYGGHVAKYLGDGVLAYFGWPQAYEDQAERAVRAGLDAVEAVNDVQVSDESALAARVGIATGQVVVGDLIGENDRDVEAVTGETPNLAARLQGVAKPGEIVVGEATHRLIGRIFDADDLGIQELKGFEDGVPAWRIVGEMAAESRFESTRGGRLTHIVGRETELRLLQDRWSLAQGGEGQVALISGEAGIGKSRLIQELYDQVADDPQIRIRYQCSPHHTNSALYPTIQQLERSAGFAPNDSGSEKLDKLEGLIHRAGDDLLTDAPLFANLLSLPHEERYGALDYPPQELKERLLEALMRQLLALAERRPVLFLFEDTHWIDPTSQEFLEQMVARLQDARVLLVITHRPEWRSPFTGYNHVTSLQLNRLGRVQGAEIVREIVGESVSTDVIERIVQRTDGIPLFVEELTKTLLEGGMSLEEAEIPKSLQASLTERLDRLGEAKNTAQVGAVFGRDVPHALLTAVSGISEVDLNSNLERLVKSELMFRRGEAPNAIYTFKHALVRDTAYDSLLYASRRQLHAHVAEALEIHFPGILEGEPEVVAHHWLEAGEPARAIPLLQRAGRIARERSADKEALVHLLKALELNDALPAHERRKDQEMDILVALGTVLMVLRGYGHAEVGQLWQRAHEQSDQSSTKEHLYLIAWNLWLHHQQAGHLKVAANWSEEVIRLANADASDEHRLEAHHAVWTTAMARGQLATARLHCEDGIEIYVPERHHVCTYSYGGHDPGICAHAHASVSLSLLGFQDQALVHRRQAIELAESFGHGPSVTVAHALTSFTYFIWRDCETARETSEQAVAAAEKFGPAHLKVIPLCGRAWAKTALGSGTEGLQEAEEAIAQYKTTGTIMRLPGCLLVLAEIHLALGDLDKALSVVDEAINLIEDKVEFTYWADLTRLKAEILLAQSGNNDEVAESLFQRAIEIAAEQDARLFGLRSAVGLARYWRNQGRAEDARSVLSPIYTQFTEGFGMRDMVEAKDLLDELS